MNRLWKKSIFLHIAGKNSKTGDFVTYFITDLSEKDSESNEKIPEKNWFTANQQTWFTLNNSQ